MISRRRLVQLSAAFALALGLLGDAALAQAQAWPNRHVRLVVPFPVGGGVDAIARIVAARLSEIWGQQVLIENRGGASGNLAAESVARSAPDGYTMFLAGDFQATNIHLYPKLRSGRRLHAGLARGALSERDGRAELLARPFGRRVYRLCQGEPGQAHLCLPRPR